jgi:hypothetical protein
MFRPKSPTCQELCSATIAKSTEKKGAGLGSGPSNCLLGRTSLALDEVYASPPDESTRRSQTAGMTKWVLGEHTNKTPSLATPTLFAWFNGKTIHSTY